MKHFASPEFWARFAKLPVAVQDLARENYELLKANPYHPGEGTRPLTEAENAYVTQVRQWDEVERGYSAIQSTRPQTLGYTLNDSPAGLAAWILEKWRAWSDSDGDLEVRFSQEFLLTMLTLLLGHGANHPFDARLFR